MDPKHWRKDATNERYYAEQTARSSSGRVPVILVVASQAVDKPGLREADQLQRISEQSVGGWTTITSRRRDDYTRPDYRS